MPTMPAVIECGESGSGSLVINTDGTRSRAVQLRWLVSGLAGYDEAEARGLEIAPDELNGHRRVRCEPQVIGGGWYQITAEYANGSLVLEPSPDCLGTFGSWAFDFEQSSEHVTQAYTDPRGADDEEPDPNKYVKAHIPGYQDTAIGTEYVPGFFVPDYRGAIGVDLDQVRGADIPRGSLSWTETWHFPAWLLTEERPPLKELGPPDENGDREEIETPQPPLLEVFQSLACKTNKRSFRGFAEGEVLMGTPRSTQIHAGQSMASITFSFTRRPTRKNFWVGDILVPYQEGWDILDIKYETAAETSELIRKPKLVYVMKVIPPADFDLAGIGAKLPRYWLEDKALAHQFDEFVARGVT